MPQSEALPVRLALKRALSAAFWNPGDGQVSGTSNFLQYKYHIFFAKSNNIKFSVHPF
jgi:hypothetical protein